MTGVQKQIYKEKNIAFCVKLSAQGFTFPEINGEYILKAFNENFGYYKIKSGYAIIYEGKTHLDFTKAQIVSCNNINDVVANYDPNTGLWFDYFGDCKPSIEPLPINIDDI